MVTHIIKYKKGFGPFGSNNIKDEKLDTIYCPNLLLALVTILKLVPYDIMKLAKTKTFKRTI